MCYRMALLRTAGFHDQPRGNVSEELAKVWQCIAKEAEGDDAVLPGCLFFGHVENILLYELVPEIMRHYEWM
jgi:hypothetical protein